jgi:hypothetical protein
MELMLKEVPLWIIAEGSGCTNCAVSEPFTLQPTTIVWAT